MRLLRESKKLIKRSQEILDSDIDELSEVFGKTRQKRKSKAVGSSSRR